MGSRSGRTDAYRPVIHHPLYRYGMLVPALWLLAEHVHWHVTLPPGFTGDPYVLYFLVLAFLLIHLASAFKWPKPVSIVLYVLAPTWGWFCVFYIKYLSPVPFPLPPPTGVALSGALYFAGRPIHELTSVGPTFSFNNVDTGERAIRPETKYDSGRFEIRELPPGDYVMFVAVNANADNPGRFPGYPGDFLLRAKAGRVSIPQGGTTFDVGLAQVIHLTLPQDNGSVMERWGEKGPDMIAFESPVEFAWDAVTDGAQYHCAIHRMQSEPFQTLERDVEKSTTEATRVALALAPNEPNQFYLFQLNAAKGQHRIGELVTHGERGYGNDLRFRVK